MKLFLPGRLPREGAPSADAPPAPTTREGAPRTAPLPHPPHWEGAPRTAPLPHPLHLTYCTNIHPGEDWVEVRRNLEHYVLAVKSHVAPDRRFGVGLRLSAKAADALAEPSELKAFQDFLRVNDLYVFTMNGFPHGVFHGSRVKEEVYLPNWMSEERLRYTDRLAHLLAQLLPSDPALEGSVSTVPGALKSCVRGESDVERMRELLIRHVACLHSIHERTGKIISLALEPEPCCYLETVDETIDFFQRHLFGQSAVTRVSDLTGLARGESEALLRRHLGVCFDACHMAVEFEEPSAALRALKAAAIRVSKIQVSAGLTVLLDGQASEKLSALGSFNEAVYLHQVVERRHDGLTRYLDLPQALDAAQEPADEPREWRIHFHVPLFLERLGLFHNTQDHLHDLLDVLRQEPVTQHLEVETYTWEVLPEEYRRDDIVIAIARELRWVAQRLTG